MSIIVDDIAEAGALASSLAQRLKTEREARGWSLSTLAERAGVSRAMISKVERGEASPTAMVLGRLSGAFGLTLSTLLARAEAREGGVWRVADQPLWRDPGTGYRRRAVLAPSRQPLELTEVELPPGVEVGFPGTSYAFVSEAIWVRTGKLILIEEAAEHRLAAGDSIVLGVPQARVFRNASGTRPCRYLVALARF